MEIVGQAEAVHDCREELPRPSYFKTHPDRIRPGSLARCSCGKTWVWEYYGYSETWNWTPVEVSIQWKLPR